MNTKSPRSPVQINMPDTLKHFSKHGAGVKLTALLICRLPFILAAAGTLVAGVLKIAGWW